MIRIRINYAKIGSMRYTGNLDINKVLERTLRRANLPLAYSQGFHPQPRMNQACPLPLGMTSTAEILDCWLEEDLSIEEINNRLQPALPPGIEVNAIREIDLHERKVQTLVDSTEYTATLLDEVSAEELAERIQSILSADTLPRERRGKKYDLRPLIENLEMLAPDESGHQRFLMHLAARQGATGRADEVLNALGFDPGAARLVRTKIHLITPLFQNRLKRNFFNRVCLVKINRTW